MEVIRYRSPDPESESVSAGCPDYESGPYSPWRRSALSKCSCFRVTTVLLDCGRRSARCDLTNTSYCARRSYKIRWRRSQITCKYYSFGLSRSSSPADLKASYSYVAVSPLLWCRPPNVPTQRSNKHISFVQRYYNGKQLSIGAISLARFPTR